jgi:hypothetical protein
MTNDESNATQQKINSSNAALVNTQLNALFNAFTSP